MCVLLSYKSDNKKWCPTVTTTAGIYFSSFQLQVLEEAHLVELTRGTRKGHNSYNKKITL
jgi:hypothetical protein